MSYKMLKTNRKCERKCLVIFDFFYLNLCFLDSQKRVERSAKTIKLVNLTEKNLVVVKFDIFFKWPLGSSKNLRFLC